MVYEYTLQHNAPNHGGDTPWSPLTSPSDPPPNVLPLTGLTPPSNVPWSRVHALPGTPIGDTPIGHPWSPLGPVNNPPIRWTPLGPENPIVPPPPYAPLKPIIKSPVLNPIIPYTPYGRGWSPLSPPTQRKCSVNPNQGVQISNTYLIKSGMYPTAQDVMKDCDGTYGCQYWMFNGTSSGPFGWLYTDGAHIESVGSVNGYSYGECQ